MKTDPLEQEFALARANAPNVANAPDPDDRWRELSLAHSAFRRETGEVIVSQRALVEADLAHARAEEWDRLSVGQQRVGHVVARLPFGAFVDVGSGVQAMLHEPDAVFDVGQLVNVEVIRMDPATRRLMVKQIT